MLPEVIIHTATSIDGRITNFPADLDQYYMLAARWNPDAVLFGSSTILSAPSLEVPPEHTAMFTPPPGSGSDPRPLMVVVDSQGKIRCWDILRKWPYFRGFAALCSSSTPGEYMDYLRSCGVPAIVTGGKTVDIRAAMETLNRQYGVEIVRADCGGTLNSVLLQSGIVREVSVLIHPFLAGGSPVPTMFDPARAGITGLQIPLTLLSSETVGNVLIWARYTPGTPSNR